MLLRNKNSTLYKLSKAKHKFCARLHLNEKSNFECTLKFNECILKLLNNLI